ncbi:MAG: hypothetical protein WCR83_03025 [Candidatus Methanomethylophilaceae archaeon]
MREYTVNPMNAHATISTCWRKMCSLDSKKKILCIFIVGLLFYGALITFDHFVTRDIINDMSGQYEGHKTDLDYYRERAQNILDGEIPYTENFQSESPPLIMYLLVIPQVFGGADWMYQIYFSLFVILTSMCIYWVFRERHEKEGFEMAMLYMFIPFVFIECVFGIQDEMITTFFFIMPILIYGLGKVYTGIAFGTLGVWVKFFNVLFLPAQLIYGRDNRERLIILLTGVSVSLIVLLPFFIYSDPNILLTFLKYYLTGGGSDTIGDPQVLGGFGGISPWHFLAIGGLRIPSLVFTVSTVVGIFAASIYGYMRKMSVTQTSALVMLVFFVCYPKILNVYFIMPAVLFLLWGVKDRRVTINMFLLIIFVMPAVLFTEIQETYIFGQEWWWVGLLISLVGFGLFVWTYLRYVHGKTPFIDDAPAT